MKSPEEITRSLKKRWDRGEFLSAHLKGEEFLAVGPRENGYSGEEYSHGKEKPFPLRIPLPSPSSKEMLDQFGRVQKEVQTLRSWAEKRGLLLDEREVNHRHLGKNLLPEALVIPDMHTLASLLGEKKSLKKISTLFHQLAEELPELAPWGAAHPFELLRQENALERLIAICKWLREHPRPCLYLRQISLPGVDTKFIEQHRAILSGWFELLLPPERIDYRHTGAKGFERRYGFLQKPELVRLRFLDPHNAPLIGGRPLSDISLPAEEFRTLELPGIETIFVAENDITALSFPRFPGGVVIFGRGYNFSALEDARLLENLAIYYLGDIDTHGFAILNQFRSRFSQAKSMLMDRQTLLEHRIHWSREKSPTRTELTNLTEEEQELYDELRFDQLGKQVRLEQEFIRFERVESAVGHLKKKEGIL